MNSLSTIFWLLVLVLISYVGFKVVPIYYRGIIGIRAVCQENADIYHKFGRIYITSNMSESLEDMGIPADKRQVSITTGKDKVFISIYYHDRANFEDYYVKDFEFGYECEGVLRSVYR